MSNDETREKLLNSISNPHYNGRTLSAISRETGLSKKEIYHLIQNDSILREKIKLHPRKAANGKRLITTKSNFYKSATMRDKFIDFFATMRPGGIADE